ncbi:MAG: hypothetical protein PWP23_908 [Candidatus Sumerlaeota bacterium]|nr:hypothetical protein [Candidatus Sumerlaeota bacterium]
MEVHIRLQDDSSIGATIFPLLSHQYDNPIDTLESFLNRRQREFFPARLRDGSEALIPLSQCYVVELTHRTVKAMLQTYPQMSEISLVESKEDVESFAIMSATLTNKRLVKGTAWFHIHVPETERNISDYANMTDRFMILHGSDVTYFVRRDAIQWVKAIPMSEAIKGSTVMPEGLEDRRQSSLVDTKFRFADPEALEAEYEESYEEYYEEVGAEGAAGYESYVNLPDHMQNREDFQPHENAPLTPSRVIKKPSFDDIDENPEYGESIPPAGQAYPSDEHPRQDLPYPPETPGGASGR